MLAISDQKMFEVIKIQNFPKTSVEFFPTKQRWEEYVLKLKV